MPSPCPTLETERLVMRPFRDSDLDDYAAMLTTDEVRAALHLPDDLGADQAWESMAVFLGQWALRGTGQWALEERATGTFVGRAGLHNPVRRGWPGTEVGWTLHPDHWGHGYATEAGARARDYAFEHLGLNEVFSLILPTNRRSQAVATRLGFELTGTRVLDFWPDRPHGVWRLGRDAWRTATRAGS